MRLKQLLFFVILCLLGFRALAIDPPYTTILSGAKNEIKVGATADVKDSVFYNTTLQASIQRNNSVLNVVQLRLNEFSTALLPDSFRVTMHVDIAYSPISSSGTTYTIVDSVLSIQYNKKRSYASKDFLFFNNAVYSSVRITSLQVDYATQAQVLPFLELENEIITDRDYILQCTSSAITTVTWSDATINNTGELAVSWSPVLPAEEYDLEWTYVDNSALQAGNYNVNGQLNANLLFRNNASRVSIKNTSYSIPLLYEGDGKLFFRVRTVQYLPSGERKTTGWSSDYTTGLGQYVIVSGHEQNLNWQSAISFAEEGKRKAVVQYFDGALYNRQTVTKDNTTSTTVVAETLYDKQGRAAIQVLPTPTLSSLIKYTPKFNTLNSAEYDKDVYDPASKVCDSGAPAMDESSGAAQYYSPSNPQKEDGFHKFIPNAYRFAFSETQYENDNAGRVAKQGGVGKEHQIGTGHETKFSYSAPSQKQLDALFGTEAGIASHYQKNMVRDANGQYSVSYVDMNGKTIATALAGNSPGSLSPLSSNRIRTLTEDLLDPSNNVVKGNVIESVHSFLVPAAGDYSFQYGLDPQSLQLQDCQNQSICYDCLYDLEITITDDCNNQKLPGGVPFVVSKNNFGPAGVDTTCAPAQSLSLNFELKGLPEGSYTVTKRLRVSEQKMQAYRDSLFLAHNTCKTYQDFYRQAMDSVLKRFGNCANDSTTTAAYKSYREQMLFDLTPPYGQYANPDPLAGCSYFSIFSIYQQVVGIYRDEAGNEDFVTVVRNGDPVPLRPQQLTQEEFIDNFKASWAETLLSYHPEYCLLQKYEGLANSHVWDEDFEKTNTYAEAVAKGYLNPTKNAAMPLVGRFPAVTEDPLFAALSSNGYAAQSTDARSKLDSYLSNITGDPQKVVSAWGFATAAAKCTETDEQRIQSQCSQWTTDANAFNTAVLCAGELDMAWRIFRGLYLDKKAEWIDTYIRSGCVEYNFSYANTETPPLCNPIFPKRDAVLSANGLDFSSITQYQQAQQRGSDSLNAFYDNTCRGYATRWFQQLATCNYSAADSAAIIDQLIAVCKEGADSNHPLGASSVKPSSTSTLRSFDDVIKDYNAAHNIAYNANCNGYLIDLPKSWEGSSVLSVNLPTYSKPDSCTCNRIAQLNNEYQSVKSSYTSFSNYLLIRYQTSISSNDLDTLMGLCSGTINCKYIAREIKLPPVLQCAAKTCVDCAAVSGLYDVYKATFPDAVPAVLTASDETQESKNDLFENFMNNKLGFDKSYQQYLDFIENCKNPNKTSCDSSWTVYDPGQDLLYHADFYTNSSNNIAPYSQHFDGQSFVSPPATQTGHYVLVNKKVTVAANDTLVTVRWRVQLSTPADYVNPVVKSSGTAGEQNWLGATWVKDPADTTWLIGTTLINRVGTVTSLTGLGLAGNSHPMKADYVRIYNSQNQLLYAEEFNFTCSASGAMSDRLCNNPKGGDEISLEASSPCADSAWLATIAATDMYRAYKDSLNDAFANAYMRKCLSAAMLENFAVTHPVQEYHYTLYYYDQAGNLIKTIPPEGVDETVYNNPTYFDDVKAARTAGTWKGPNHTLETTYRYNSLNQVVSQQSPDGGLSQFWYDRLGRLAVSQNAKQKLANNYSYTLYDTLGRITEVGQKLQITAMTQATSRSPQSLNTWLNNGSGFDQVTRTVYDKVATLPTVDQTTAATFRQKAYTMRNRVSHTLLYNTLAVNTAGAPLYDDYTTGTYYSYDIHGNVDSLLQDYRVGLMQQHGVNRFKLLAYKYDLISGKVNQVHYQPGERDELYHRYEYDAENRLTDVYTTFRKEFVGQKNLEEHEAFYQYFKHGPLAKTILGQQQVQGVDYAYTLQGWLKGVNLDSTLEDNVTARDVYSFSLHYFPGDYAAISSNTPTLVNASGNADFRPLYNGNIGAMAVNIKPLRKPLVYNYGYDQLNRLVSMDAFDGWKPEGNTFAPNKLPDFKEQVRYDANGNILSYLRHGESSTSGVLMDSLVYQYERTAQGRLKSNRLRYVHDGVQGNAFAGDLKTQTALDLSQVVADNNSSQASDNYSYDAIGNLTKDVKAGITAISWNVYGKIEQITKDDNTVINYGYDAAGNRISKTVSNAPNAASNGTTWYVRDAQGTVMAVYTTSGSALNLSEQHLYGSSRLGVWNRKVNMDVALPTPYTTPGLGTINSTVFERGSKAYELSNHLGNVLVTISDRKFGIPSPGNSSLIDHSEADVLSTQDYYPFGMLMPGRTNSSASYRYRFNGKENDNEVKGEGNQQDYGMRIYDPRLGRFLSMDPISKDYPFYSPYHFAGNTPIRAFDLDGLEITFSDVWHGRANLVDWFNDPTTWTSGAQTFNEHANPIYIGYQHGWEIWNGRDYYTGMPKTRANAIGETGIEAVAWLAGEKLFTSIGRTGNVMERQMLRNSAAMGQVEKSTLQQQAQKLTNAEIKNTVTQSTRLPVSNGSWTGIPGNSLWKSTLSEVNSVTGGKGIPFINGRPNFTPWAKASFSVEGLTGNNTKDFALVYKKMVQDWGFKSQKAAADWLKANKLTIHHESNNVMQLVPSDLHNNIPHVGSASSLRKR